MTEELPAVPLTMLARELHMRPELLVAQLRPGHLAVPHGVAAALRRQARDVAEARRQAAEAGRRARAATRATARWAGPDADDAHGQ